MAQDGWLVAKRSARACGAVLVLLTAWAGVALAGERSATPTERQIEALLRKSLGDVPLRDYQQAELRDFELVQLQRVGPLRWQAETDLMFDFGTPPPAVIGYQRERRGLYELVLQRDRDGELRLLRFTPVGSVQRLPRI